MIETIAPDGVRAVPLARYLARAYPLIPGWVIREAIKNKDVRVNGAKVGAANINAGDVVRAYIPDKYLDRSIDIIYRGEGLLVVDKPMGLPVDADYDGVGEDTALVRARAIDPGARLCHRLDAGTGGVLILATDEAAYEKALNAFRGHDLEKTYECVVKGAMERPRGTLVNYLVKDAKTALVRAFDAPRPGAARAELSYVTLEETDKTALVLVSLVTGKTHQIRAQFARAGHPLIGDDKYGDRDTNKAFKVQTPMLWCREIVYNGHRFTSAGGVKCI